MAQSRDTAAIQMSGLYKSFAQGEQQIPVLHNIDVRIESGEFVAVVGPSGSGKSTLLNILGCLDGFDRGSYQLMGQSMADADDDTLSQYRQRYLGFVFQSFHLLANKSALDNVCLPLVYSDVPRKQWRQRGMDLLAQFGLEKHHQQRPGQLSGGQQQRVALARALVSQPDVLLADEPTGSLDQHNGEQVIDALETLVQQGLTLIMVTHDSAVAARAHRSIHLLDGRISP